MARPYTSKVFTFNRLLLFILIEISILTAVVTAKGDHYDESKRHASYTHNEELNWVRVLHSQVQKISSLNTSKTILAF